MITEHLATGLIIGGFFNKSKSQVIPAVSIISSLLADLPVLFMGGPGEIDYLSHRIYTHTIILSPLYALIPVLLMFIFLKNKLKHSFFYLFLISFLSYSTHIFIDLLTPFGVQLFYPLSNKIFSLDLFHAFDPIAIFLSITIISISLYQWFKLRYIKKSILLGFISIIGLYLIYTLSAKIHYSKKYSSFITESKGSINYLTTVPRTFWRWKGIAKKNQTSFIIYEEKDRIELNKFKSSPIANNSIKTSSEYLKFIEYARYPINDFTENNYSFFNLVYSPKSYNLSLKLDSNNEIKFSKITGFDILDEH
jgi:membrane-bound metal-dependent hydrolase YbcI (DUF457 family)